MTALCMSRPILAPTNRLDPHRERPEGASRTATVSSMTSQAWIGEDSSIFLAIQRAIEMSSHCASQRRWMKQGYRSRAARPICAGGCSNHR